MREHDKAEGIYIRALHPWKPDGTHRLFSHNTGRGATVLGTYPNKTEAEAARLYALDLDQHVDWHPNRILMAIVGSALFIAGAVLALLFFPN